MGSRAISETVSDISVRRRGRPAVMDASESSLWRGLFPEVKSSRGLNDVHYRQRALSILGGGLDPRFFWLANGPKMERGEAKSWRPTVLTELGRFDDQDLLLAVAVAICEAKPKSNREAVARVRCARLGIKPGDPSALAEKIRSAINAYLVKHPDTEWTVILEAIEMFRTETTLRRPVNV